MYIYLKFGSLADMTDLLENGTIYCNPISEFAKSDDGCRYDKNELVSKMEYYEGGNLTLIPEDNPEQVFNLKITTAHYKEHIANPVGNLYCLFALNLENAPENHIFMMDERLKKFGTHFVLIHNSKEFSKRMVSKLKEDGIKIEQGKIEYLDYSKYTGEKYLFTKSLEYEYQNEYRLHLLTGKNSIHRFQIGNMNDIAKLYITADVNKLTKVRQNNNVP